MPFDLSKLTTQILSDKLGSSAEIDIDTFHSFIVSLFELDYDPELLKTELAEFIPDDTGAFVDWLLKTIDVTPVESSPIVPASKIARERSRSRSPAKSAQSMPKTAPLILEPNTGHHTTSLTPDVGAPNHPNMDELDISDVIVPTKNGKSCVNHPYCHYGPSCVYTHPGVPCKFGSECHNSSCNWMHSEDHTKRLIKLKSTETASGARGGRGRGGRGGAAGGNQIQMMMQTMMQMMAGGRGGRGGARGGRGGFHNLTVDLRKDRQQQSGETGHKDSA